MQPAKHNTGYGSLLRDGRFEGFLWAQFLGAFNDNVYKMIVSFTAVHMALNSATSGRYLALAGAVFIFPFILFSGYAGQLADRYSKTRVLQITKSLEIVTMAMGIATDGLNRLFSNRSDALRLVRDVGLGLVDRVPALKGLFIREAAGLTGDVPKLLRGEAL